MCIKAIRAYHACQTYVFNFPVRAVLEGCRKLVKEGLSGKEQAQGNRMQHCQPTKHTFGGTLVEAALHSCDLQLLGAQR